MPEKGQVLMFNEAELQLMKAVFEAKQLKITYLEQQFQTLREGATSTVSDRGPHRIKLSYLASLERLNGEDNHIWARRCFVNATARNFILGYVDPMLNMIKV